MDCCDSIPTADVIETKEIKCLHCLLIYTEHEFLDHKCSVKDLSTNIDGQ